MGDTSLVNGFVPLFVFVLAPVLLVLSISWRDGRWKHESSGSPSIAAGVTLVVLLVNERFKLIPYAFPTFFYLLLGLIVLAGVILVTGWRADANWQRVVAVLATLSMVALLGVIVNRHYRYYPTVSNLLGKVAENELGLPELNRISEEVARTGTLPAKGYTVHTPIPGPKSGFTGRDAYVYLPPAYFATPAPELPVLLMLHGVPGGPENWPQAGNIDEVADAFAATHDGKTPILVMPDSAGDTNNDTLCVNSERGNVETYLTEDVVDYVRATFHPATGPNTIGVAGFSDGAFCSLLLALRNPEVFTTFGDYSGYSQPTLDPPKEALKEIFKGDQAAYDAHDPTKILAGRQFPGLSGWFEVGEQDPDPLEPTRAVSKQAAAAGIATCTLIRPGGHDFGFWEDSFRHSLPFLSAKLGLTPMPSDLSGAVCENQTGS